MSTTIISPTSHLLVPSHNQQQRAGILLNPSPMSSAPSSPRNTPYSLSPHSNPASCSSQSSASSVSSSDDIPSSASHSRSNSSSLPKPTGRKIRFAPLPDPRRDVYLTEHGDELPSCSNTENDNGYACVSPAMCSTTTSAGPSSSFTTTTTVPALPPSASTDTLGLSFDDAELLNDSGQNTETNTVIGADDVRQPDRCSKKARWKGLLRLSKPSSSLGLPNISTEDVLTLGMSSLFRPSSRDSVSSNSSNRGTVSDSNVDGRSLGRRRSTGSTDPNLSPRACSGALKNLALTQVVSEAGTSSTRTRSRPSSATSSTGMGNGMGSSVRHGTRLLNGRVYGARGNAYANGRNPFANVKDEEPEFVEWGHGGMGSVRSGAVSSRSEWAKLQSGGRLSIGHVEGGDKGNNGNAVDEDDGSGMSWVKKRREARLAKEKEEKMKAKQNEVPIQTDSETPSIQVRSASPAKEDEQSSSSAAATPTGKEPTSDILSTHGSLHSNKEKDTEHVYTAVVQIPAPKMHHHHSHPHPHPGVMGSRTSSAATILAPSSSSSTSPHPYPSSNAAHEVNGKGTGLNLHSSAPSVSPSPLRESEVEAEARGKELGLKTNPVPTSTKGPLDGSAISSSASFTSTSASNVSSIPSVETEQSSPMGSNSGSASSSADSSRRSSFEYEEEEEGDEEDGDIEDDREGIEEGERDDEGVDGETDDDIQKRKTSIGAGVEKISRHKD